MNFFEVLDKNVRITYTDGYVISGIVNEVTSAADNEPNGACCYIGDIEVLESDIESIEELKE